MIHRGISTLRILLWSTLVASSASADLIPKGDDFPVSGAESCDATRPDIAALPDGPLMAVWTTFDDGSDVLGRLFDADGTPLGVPFTVSEHTAGSQFDPVVAAGGGGVFAVVWRDSDRDALIARFFDPQGQPLAGDFVLASFFSVTTGPPRAALASRPGQRFTAAWERGNGGIDVLSFDELSSFPVSRTIGPFPSNPFPVSLTQPDVTVDESGNVAIVHLYATFGRPLDLGLRFLDRSLDHLDSMSVTPLGSGPPTGPVVEGSELGGFVVAWEETRDDGAVGIYARRYDAALDPLGGPFRADGGEREATQPAIATASDGTLAIVWSGFEQFDPGSPQGFERDIYGRVFAPDGTTLSGEVRLNSVVTHSQFNPRVAASSDNLLVATWWTVLPPPPTLPAACTSSGAISARSFGAGCVPGDRSLCLEGDRFGVEAAWRLTQSGPSHPATAVPLTDDTGAFWFFEEDNLELMTKVIDGRSQNDHHWFFYGALSTVGYDITVTDFETDTSKTYSNPPGTLASVGDTEAFPAAASRAETSSAPTDRLVADPAVPSLFVGAELDSALRLNNDRFEVTVDWTDPFNGGSGQGVAVPITGDTGTFWFFRPENLELMVKVLDGRPVNGRFWVFYGALTNVGYTVTVTDRLTGVTKTYDNPPFQFASVADTAAF